MGLLGYYDDPFERFRSQSQPDGGGRPDEGGLGPSPISAAPQVPGGTLAPNKPTALPEDTTWTPRAGGGGGGGSGFNVGKPTFEFGAVPEFTPPQFKAPTFEDALNEPGYQFRQQAGEDALQRSQAARGLLRTGGSLKDLIGYGQKFASEEYGNVFNRALSSYDRQYQGAHDAFAPRLAQWQTLSNAEMQAVLAQYNMRWDKYKFDHPHYAPMGPPSASSLGL